MKTHRHKGTYTSKTKYNKIAVKKKPIHKHTKFKDITTKQYRKMFKRLVPEADYDGDSKPNWVDCRPFDKKRQDEHQERFDREYVNMEIPSRNRRLERDLIKRDANQGKLIEEIFD